MPTIKDVAKACGVSTATVSYVLNGKSRLPPETRERVMRTVRALNYHPNAMARGLSHKRLNTIGVMFGVIDTVAVITHPYASHILQGIITVASSVRNNVTFYTDPWRTAGRSAANYRDRRADGLIVVAAPLDSDIISGLSVLDIPLVAVSFPGSRFNVPSVDTDNKAVMQIVFEHLRGLGHKRIAHIAGPPNMDSALVREKKYRSLMQEHGLATPPEYYGPGSYDRGPAYEYARRLLMMPEPPTAIIAGNDACALGAIDAARDLGISVPVRLSVVGVDDIPEGALGRPALTTVQQPLFELGEMAAKLLRRRIDGEIIDPCEHYLPPRLIVRESTAPPII